MQTVLRSKTGVEVVIGPDTPFVIIGERINPTGRKALAAEMLAGNFERVKEDALAQVQGGRARAGCQRRPRRRQRPRARAGSHGEGHRGRAVGRGCAAEH